MDAQQVFEVISSTKSSSTSGFLSKSVNYAILGDLVDLSVFISAQVQSTTSRY
jgi:hypothetical protein